MDDIKEKLKRLRQERESRAKSQVIRDTWEEMERKENLSTKEKLEQLIHLTKKKKKDKPPPPHFEPQEREPLQYSENALSKP